MGVEKSVKFWLFAVAIVAIGHVIFTGIEIVRLKEENERLGRNVQVLTSKPVIKDSGRTIEVQHLEMTLSEIKKSIPGIKDDLKKIDLNVNRLSSFQKASMEVNAKFMASATDTLIKNQVYNYQHFTDKFLQFSSLQKNGDTTSNVKIVVPIEITNAGTLFREGFPFGLGWFKPWRLRQTMHTTNPYVDLKYQQVIDVKRK